VECVGDGVCGLRVELDNRLEVCKTVVINLERVSDNGNKLGALCSTGA
jgi:hypothetical protein